MRTISDQYDAVGNNKCSHTVLVRIDHTHGFAFNLSDIHVISVRNAYSKFTVRNPAMHLSI